jgi:phenylpropionate dioxygenase-like ring-hydroxylating dioxygenase large terminal subunit
MYVRNCWYVTGWSSELGAAELISRSVINQALVLYRGQDGSVAALEDRCCHRFAPLSKGRREGDDLRCMYHGLRFGRNGVCNDIPGQNFIPPKARVRTFPVLEKHSWIWVWMGDPAKADEKLVPSAVGLDDPRYTLRYGQMDYKANYLLINDNLTDFSHLSYVHANSFQASEDWARERNEVSRIARGIRVQRWLPANPQERAAVSSLSRAFDSWSTYDYLAPGILLMYNAIFPPGSAQASKFAPPDVNLRPCSESFTSQAVTPMTDRASRYFYSWGPNAAAGSDAMADEMLKVAHAAFAEDRIMIEAQQAVIDRSPPTPPVLTAHDQGPSLMRRVLEDLIAEDSAPDQSASPSPHPPSMKISWPVT